MAVSSGLDDDVVAVTTCCKTLTVDVVFALLIAVDVTLAEVVATGLMGVVDGLAVVVTGAATAHGFQGL